MPRVHVLDFEQQEDSERNRHDERGRQGLPAPENNDHIRLEHGENDQAGEHDPTSDGLSMMSATESAMRTGPPSAITPIALTRRSFPDVSDRVTVRCVFMFRRKPNAPVRRTATGLLPPDHLGTPRGTRMPSASRNAAATSASSMPIQSYASHLHLFARQPSASNRSPWRVFLSSCMCNSRERRHRRGPC